MPLMDLTALPPDGVLIGLDPGRKTIGVAATDPARMMAWPVTTLARTKLAPTLEGLLQIYDRLEARGCVIGLPLNVDGSAGPRVQSVRTLAASLLKVRDIPIAFQDERYSTVEAAARLHSAGTSRRRSQVGIDAAAAAIILGDALGLLEARR